ncbi:MAG: hypothetical protein JW885_16360 [Deltaproteobacteria bacterium]|nr:hypothetical protein [Candidatus Zymogenaceae bacterium]
MSENEKNTGAEQAFVHEFADTTGVADFTFKNVDPPPAGYPSPSPDEYSFLPFAESFEDRKKAFVTHCLNNPACDHIKGYYYELIRISEGKGPVYESLIDAALTYIDQRFDCSDFVMLGIIRLLYQLAENELVSQDLLDHARKTILDFKYMPDEPGIDSMCYWTENHVIMFAVNEYLAGQLYPERVFTNSGMTGHEKMTVARKRIEKWLELRFQTGFSEWLSHIYYDENVTALINLVDFAKDPQLVRGAEIVLDLLFLDMALNSFHGTFGSSHGRSYAEEKRDGTVESTTDIQKLMFGMGRYAGADNMGAVCLALSDSYRLPRAIQQIVLDTGRDEVENRQRMGIRLDQAKRWGLSYDDFDSGIHFLSLEAYLHPLTVNLVMRMFDAYRWWDNQFFSPFKPFRGLIRALRSLGLMPALAWLVKKDACRNTREEVNLYTYRTPDYQLACAQDYRKGYGGDQQHIWQATLSPKAVCFTTHPGHEENTSGGYWVGSGTLPRVAQEKSVLVACYRASKMPGLYMTNKLFFTHAWFPRKEFDEVREEGGWIFGRKGDGYIALYSRNGYRWQDEGEDKGCEVIADGRKNIWICQMGRRAVDDTFDEFISKVASAPLRFRGLSVVFESPTEGSIRFGWRGAFQVKGKRVSLFDYPRYDNRYVDAPFPPDTVEVGAGGHSVTLNLKRGIRRVSEYCG